MTHLSAEIVKTSEPRINENSFAEFNYKNKSLTFHYITLTFHYISLTVDLVTSAGSAQTHYF